MAHLKYLILALLVVCNLAIAGYAQLRPPPGWSQGLTAAVPGNAGVFSFGAAANGSSFKGGTVLTNAALNVAGQLVTVPVSMRVAANAATVAAEYSFGNPYLFAGALAAPFVYQWLKDKGLEVKDGAWMEHKVQEGCSEGACYEYSFNGTSWGSKGSAASQGIAARNTNTAANTYVQTGFIEPLTVEYKRTYNYANPPEVSFSQFNIIRRLVPVEPGDVWAPVLKPEFIERMKNSPLPDGAHPELPEVNWPVEEPVINPDPAVIPQPSPAPDASPRPLNVPTGNPVPTADPNVWNQPIIRIVPSPAPGQPFRVDLQPHDVPQDSPVPKTPAQLNPVTPTPSTPGAPKAPETPGLCDLYPDILACAKLDDGKDTTLETKDKPITITPDSGWGSGGGACPAGRTLSHGAVYSFQPICDFASGVKPVLIAVAWLGAALLLIGAKGGSD
jgi:hypothetical protein